MKEVQIASVEVRRIAENLGGFVEHLSSSGGASSQQANQGSPRSGFPKTVSSPPRSASWP